MAALPWFLGGQFALLVGTSLEQMVVAWVVYHLSDSSTWLGVVGFVTGVSGAVAALLGGVVGDRLGPGGGPRKVLMRAQSAATAACVALLGLAALGRLEIGAIVVFAAAAGFCSGPNTPLLQALLPVLAGKSGSVAAMVAASSIVYDIARIAGPASAGFILVHGSAVHALLAAALCHGMSVASLQRLPSPLDASNSKAATGLVAALAEGLSEVASSSAILVLIALSVCICIANSALTVLMPVMARNLSGGPATFGLLMAALSAGALCGGIFLRLRSGAAELPLRIPLGAFGFGLSVLLFSFAASLPWGLAALVIAGFALNVAMSSCTSVLLSVTAEEVRSRVVSFFTLSFMAMAPVSGLLAGLASEVWTARTVIAAAAAIAIVASITLLRLVRLLKTTTEC